MKDIKGILTGVALFLGGAVSFGAGVTLTRLDILSQPSVVPITPISTPIAQVIPTVTVTPPAVDFDKLSPCDQLDSIARSGKSVADFLVAANRVNDLAKYRLAIGSSCSWNADQFVVADRIINPPPPPVVVQPAPIEITVERSASGGNGSRQEFQTVPYHPRWNNCDGTIDPGESYSQACANAQQFNDYVRQEQIYIPENPIDNRPEAARPAPGSNSSQDREYPRGWSN